MSTNPGAEAPRDARDSGSARSHSMHLETRSSDRPKMVTYMEHQTTPSYMSVTCAQRTLRKPNFMRIPHTQTSLRNISKWDLNFGELSHSLRMTQLGQNFQLPLKIRIPNNVSLSNFPKWDSNFGEPTHSRRTTNSDEIFQLPPKINYQTHTLFDIHVNSNNNFPTDKMNVVLTLVGLPQRSQP